MVCEVSVRNVQVTACNVKVSSYNVEVSSYHKDYLHVAVAAIHNLDMICIIVIW